VELDGSEEMGVFGDVMEFGAREVGIGVLASTGAPRKCCFDVRESGRVWHRCGSILGLGLAVKRQGGDQVFTPQPPIISKWV
jgi:hypothetical protein